jgi:hypothetical protein
MPLGSMRVAQFSSAREAASSQRAAPAALALADGTSTLAGGEWPVPNWLIGATCGVGARSLQAQSARTSVLWIFDLTCCMPPTVDLPASARERIANVLAQKRWCAALRSAGANLRD